MNKPDTYLTPRLVLAPARDLDLTPRIETLRLDVAAGRSWLIDHHGLRVEVPHERLAAALEAYEDATANPRSRVHIPFRVRYLHWWS